MPLAAASIIVWLLSTLEWRELIAGCAFVLVTAALYAGRERRSRADMAAPTHPQLKSPQLESGVT